MNHNPSKCTLLSKEFLGHFVATQRLQPNECDSEAVRKFPQPVNLKQLCQFIGLTSYSQRFAPGYASLAHSLYVHIRKRAMYSWTAECEIASDTLAL